MQGSFHRLAKVFLPFLFSANLLAFAAPATVLEDAPGLLRMEIRLPETRVLTGEAADAFRSGAPNGSASPGGAAAPTGALVQCAACQSAAHPGAPDLPVYRFQVASGPAAPRVTLQILESETRSLPQGLRPYPFSVTPSRIEYRVDADLFRRAAGLAATVSSARSLRGIPVRQIEVPLALWNEASRTLTLLKRIKVDVSFPGVRPRPAVQWPVTAARQIANPQGGRYLFSPPTRAALRKTASVLDAAVPGLGDNWLKIRIGDKSVESLDEDRVYSLTGAEIFAASPDFHGATFAKLRLYAGPADTLSRQMGPVSVGGTLRQVALEFVDVNDNKTLDENDRINFFGHGTSLWKRTIGDSGSIRWEFSVDPYSFENYYFLSYAPSDATPPLRMATEAPTAPVGAPRVSGYHYLRAERDLATAACDPGGHKDEESGFDWFWFWKGRCESYSDSSLTFTHAMLSSNETDTLIDWISGPQDSLFVGLYTYPATIESSFTVFAGGRTDSMAFLPAHSASGSFFVQSGLWNAGRLFPLDSVIWFGQEKRLEGYTVAYRRKYAYHKRPMWIFPEVRGAPTSYRVEGGQGVLCLRVEGGVASKRMQLDAQGIFTDSLDAGSDARYYLYEETSALPAGSLTRESLPADKTAMRDLFHGEGDPEYLIITPKELLPEAVALADYRNGDKRAMRLRTSVAVVEDIYRQFSSGRMTPVAIRDFLRWAYDGWGKGAAGSGALRYVLFFGDGHYDYRNIKASLMKAPPNFVPPWEYITPGGREEVASDDFYGWLDYADSTWDVSLLDVAVGRLPLQDEVQARQYLEKVKLYETPAKAGEWRSRVVMAADDATQRGAPGDLDPISRGHTNDTERLGRAILENEPGVTIDKVYLLDYVMNSSGLKPEASQDLLSFINRGALVINYVGHGSANQWADEILLQTTDGLSRMRNEGRTAMINAFSCTVGRYEGLAGEGMSEQLVKQKGVGAIGAVSATRESFPLPNIALALAFYHNAFPIESSTEVVPVGEALRMAKVGQETSFDNLNDLKYNLLGEPVLLLRKPQVKLTLSRTPDTLRALACDSIKGRVDGGGGEGLINIKIFAGSVLKTYIVPSGMEPQYADKRGNILFERTVPYHNHEFSTDYLIPKQISFGDTNAQIQAFAWDTTVEMEGSTAVRELRIKGTAQSSCPADDGRGPRIHVSGCESKETGGVDFPDQVKISLPYCLQIQVEDSAGGVLSADGPDEGTTLEIPGVLNPFHPQPGVDDLVRKTYQLTLDKRTIRPGSHLLKVAARDGYGNISRRQMRMEVTLDSSLTALAAFNSPNPLKKGSTVFFFSAGLPLARTEVVEGATVAPAPRLDYELRIFNQRGYLVKVFRNAESGQTSWDGTDEWGNRLANGVYFYKVIARQNLSLLDDPNPGYSTKASKRNVLVISR